MRGAWLLVALIGCGPIDLGNQRVKSVAEGFGGLDASVRLDAAVADGLDAAVELPSAFVTVRATGHCGDCFELLAGAAGGRPPYRFTWGDGFDAQRREICPGSTTASLSLTVRDANEHVSEPHLTQLEWGDAACASAPPMREQLCLQNLSFEGKAAVNSGNPGEFDAAPWNACQVPASGSNTPDIINEKAALSFLNVPHATDGTTFLGLIETEQASQTLCEPLAGGTEVSLKLDLGRVTADGIPDAERGFLEIWGGISTDCSQRELLWASPALQVKWTTYCVTLRPHQYMDQLTLRSSSDKAVAPGTTVLVTVDHLVPVSDCP